MVYKRQAASVADGRDARVTAVTVAETAAEYEAHAAFDGVREVLVRPDGHIAWATRTADEAARRTERAAALTEWTGASDGRNGG